MNDSCRALVKYLTTPNVKVLSRSIFGSSTKEASRETEENQRSHGGHGGAERVRWADGLCHSGTKYIRPPRVGPAQCMCGLLQLSRFTQESSKTFKDGLC